MKRVLTVALLLCGGLLSAQTQWLPSDSLGRSDPTSPARSSPGRGWYLGVERLDHQEKQTLVKDGAEQKILVSDFDSADRLERLRVFEGGKLVQDVAYQGGSALPQSETVFVDGVERNVYRYTWGNLGLLGRQALTPQGELLFEDKVFRLPDGRLRRLERNSPEGPVAEVTWTYDAAGLAQVWVADEDLRSAGRHKVVSYGTAGVQEDLWEDTTLLVSVLRTENDRGSVETERGAAVKGVTERVRDLRGRLIAETLTIPDQSVRRTRWTWDDKDRVVHEETEIPGGLETTDLSYDDKTTVIERRRLDQLSSRQTEVEGEKTLVELFDRGEKFLEEVWSGGRKTFERYYDAGTMIRERKL